MTVTVCISDGGGMLFRGRRQSRDKLLIKDFADLSKDEIVYISEFSLSQFEDSEANVIALSDPLSSAGEDDFVFVENLPIKGYEKKITSFVIYKWNRAYPSDVSLDVTPQKLGMTLIESVDFVGNSHERITREIWRKL